MIKSLSKSEKRYLKLGLVNKQTEHLKLFDAINKQGTYNEKAIIAANNNTAFAQNIAVYKTYLYTYILRRLSQYHKKNEEAAVLEKIRFAEILIGKKLFKQAKKQLTSAQKKAERYQLAEALLMVLKKQKELFSKTKQADFKTIHSFYEIQKETIQTIDSNTDYTFLFNEISHLQIRIQKAQNPEEIEAMENWRKHPLLNTPIETLSLENSVLYLKSIAIYHFTKREAILASQINKKLLSLLKSETAYNAKHPEQYISILNNFIIDQLTLKNISAFKEGLQQLESLSNNPAFQQVKNIKSRIFHQRFLLLFNYYFSEKKFNKAMTKMSEFTQQFPLYEAQLHKHQRLTLHYLAAVLNFGAQNFKTAQSWLIPISQETKEDVVQEIFKYTRLLNLLIHFELGNYEFTSALLPTTQRALSKQTQIQPAEKLILKYIKKMMNLTTRKEKLKLKVELKAKLIPTQEERLFKYIPVLVWLETEIKTTPDK